MIFLIKRILSCRLDMCHCCYIYILAEKDSGFHSRGQQTFQTFGEGNRKEIPRERGRPAFPCLQLRGGLIEYCAVTICILTWLSFPGPTPALLGLSWATLGLVRLLVIRPHRCPICSVPGRHSARRAHGACPPRTRQSKQNENANKRRRWSDRDVAAQT